MVLENFNIEQFSGAAGKPVIKTFQTHVTNHTLEIQFYWAGRGTTGIPYRGSYGPLISAISVTPSVFSVPYRFSAISYPGFFNFEYSVPLINMGRDTILNIMCRGIHYEDYNFKERCYLPA